MRCVCLCSLSLLLAGGAAAAPAPEYRTVNATPFGRAVVAQRRDAGSLAAALRLTRADLTSYFGAAPSVFSAYADSKDSHAGGATFLVTSKGTPIKGLVSCEVGAQATRVAVVFIRADAPPAEWARLLGQAPGAGAGGAEGSPEPGAKGGAGGEDPEVPKPANRKLRTWPFADGTGSVGLADGWTTQAQSAMHGVVLQGPQDQTVSIAQMFTVQTPQSMFRGPQALVAPFSTPAEVLTALVPQLSQASTMQGGPSRTLDHLRTVRSLSPSLPGGRAALLRAGITETKRGGESRHYQVLTQLEIDPVTASSFMGMATQARAPDAAYARDLPVMLQMIGSLKTNDALIASKNDQALSAQKQWFAAQQSRMHAQQAANDAHNQQYWANQKTREQDNRAFEDRQLQQARRNDDFDEVIRGIRTVEDTQTGRKTSVDLGNVDRIVEDLNERDPGRYRAIPLRDEVDPQR